MENRSLPTPTTVTISVEQSLASLARIRTSADRVLMNHDPSVALPDLRISPGSARPTHNPRPHVQFRPMCDASTSSARRGQACFAQSPKSRSASEAQAIRASGSTQMKLPERPK